MLEAGRKLPPDPREAGRRREPAERFVARMAKVVARYEAQHLKRAEWQVLGLLYEGSWAANMSTSVGNRLRHAWRQRDTLLQLSPCLRGSYAGTCFWAVMRLAWRFQM